MQAAWDDFHNTGLFGKERDAIALITGPLSATDTRDVRWVLSQARHTASPDEFFRHVTQANFSSRRKREKLDVFRYQLSAANQGREVSDDCLFSFLRHFHLLGCDLGKEVGVVLSLLQSHLSQFDVEPSSVWHRIVGFVQEWNQEAGTITLGGIPNDIGEAFKPRSVEAIPSSLLVSEPTLDKPDWNHHPQAPALVIASLLGAWDESNEADQKIVCHVVQTDGMEFNAWDASVREILQNPKSPLALKNGIWNVTDRASLWKGLTTRVFDIHLETLKKCSVEVLSELDPRLDLPIEDRHVANLYGKALEYSSALRMGLCETLALVGAQHSDLKNSSRDRRENTVDLTVFSIFDSADWVLWGSLDGLLPVLAEASPSEFLKAVENALQQHPCPFDELFSQEAPGGFGANHLTGLLWALETLAWDETCFVRACVILGKLAERDPGGNWGNRPTDSLTRILLPWLPQTFALPAKRQKVLKNLQKVAPQSAWNLLLSLLPDETQVSHPTHRPVWRQTIPDNWKEVVTREQYWSQISFYADLVVGMAEENVQKSILLVDLLANLPPPALERFLVHLAFESVSGLPEERRVGLWSRLTMFARKHRQFADANWAMDGESVARIEDIARNLAPEDPLRLHRMLFDQSQSFLLHDSMDWKENERHLAERRQVAIDEILSHGGLNDVLQFVEEVGLPREVGHALGEVGKDSIDLRLLPRLLESGDRKLSEFVEGYVWRRHYKMGWDWVDGIDRTHWSPSETGRILSLLPFTQEAWRRSAAWLGESQREYWIRTRGESLPSGRRPNNRH